MGVLERSTQETKTYQGVVCLTFGFGGNYNHRKTGKGKKGTSVVFALFSLLWDMMCYERALSLLDHIPFN